MARPHTQSGASYIASSANALLIQEIVRYAVKKCNNAKEASIELLEDIGYPIGYRIAERLTITKYRIDDPGDAVRFVCKDLWNFVFLTQVDRLQTDKKGGYVINVSELPWLKNVAADVAAGVESDSTLNTQATPSWGSPTVNIAIICGIIKGALANLDVNCNVAISSIKPPACSFKITMTST